MNVSSINYALNSTVLANTMGMSYLGQFMNPADPTVMPMPRDVFICSAHNGDDNDGGGSAPERETPTLFDLILNNNERDIATLLKRTVQTPRQRLRQLDAELQRVLAYGEPLTEKQRGLLLFRGLQSTCWDELFEPDFEQVRLYVPAVSWDLMAPQGFRVTKAPLAAENSANLLAMGRMLLAAARVMDQLRLWEAGPRPEAGPERGWHIEGSRLLLAAPNDIMIEMVFAADCRALRLKVAQAQNDGLIELALTHAVAAGTLQPPLFEVVMASTAVDQLKQYCGLSRGAAPFDLAAGLLARLQFRVISVFRDDQDFFEVIGEIRSHRMRIRVGVATDPDAGLGVEMALWSNPGQRARLHGEPLIFLNWIKGLRES